MKSMLVVALPLLAPATVVGAHTSDALGSVRMAANGGAAELDGEKSVPVVGRLRMRPCVWSTMTRPNGE
jgi:hypothetical protein